MRKESMFMQDDYTEYDDYDDIDYREFDTNTMINTLYFCQGAYKIKLISFLRTNENGQYLYKISRTTVKCKNVISLIELYELLENSYFLEFLVSIMSEGMLVPETCKMLITMDKNTQYINVTAEFNLDQKCIEIEDNTESDNSTTEIINIGDTQVMRTHQFGYSLTQCIRYLEAKLDIINEKTLAWNDYNIDWYAVYTKFIDPYITTLMSMALRANVEKDTDYSDYMKFSIQYEIALSENSFYLKIYILPKSVHGRNIIYTENNSREIYIENNKNDQYGMSTDELRICMGTQNLSLLPLNISDVYHTIFNGKEYIVYNELNNSSKDCHRNKFIMTYRRYTNLPISNILYSSNMEGFEQCPIILQFDEETSMKSICQFFGFINPETDKLGMLPIAIDACLLGTMCFSTESSMKSDQFVSTIEEDLNNEKTFLPKSFYKNLITKFKIPNNAIFQLIPIRALPCYREFMVVSIIKQSNDGQSQTNIIDKDKPVDKVNKQSFFRFLFKK